MTIEERNSFLTKEYAEAIRYMDNAKGILAKSSRDGNHYADPKYVRAACGTAYLGVLIALDAWLKIKDIAMPKKKKQKSIEFYTENVAKIDGKMISRLNTVYRQLHLEGYYWGETDIKVIEGGFDNAYQIIDKIKPYSSVLVLDKE